MLQSCNRFQNLLLCFRYQAQLSALQQERDELLKTQMNTTDVDAQKTLHLQRQKTQLEQRVRI